MDIAQSMLWFWTAYVVVTAVGIGHTVFNWKILGMTDEGVTATSVAIFAAPLLAAVFV